ncbi:hypothetical protein [Sporolactobacillus terrae]|uniref:YtxH domain-containing protein n=1 Tax=Sporolactobacillus terrae TaxID=269673 RepID=A0A410DAV4_9BACL|nr:hypothetical protein [Sporolactobacillus terrae]QAA23251.1 hypothetical protein C0674_11915 [Sporolactobacillus terrae]QAA26221.1 hypothetical protein C0679_11895 [Sporolactobacillus terrae]UAK15317.1 hypothetical protein K7399_09555 [Sporolactobacillus terrae]BBN99655.1 hypothetical protein St703_23600 [Sporolactobacillus terrae]
MSVYGKSHMGKFMLIGGMVGCGLSLIGRETRSVWGQRLATSASNCGNLIRAMYQHPDQVGKYMQVTGTRLKGMVREVSDDFQHMIDQVEKARTSTGDTYQYVMEVGGELAEMAGKIRQSGRNMVNYQEPELISAETEAIQRLENETSVPNPGTIPHVSKRTSSVSAAEYKHSAAPNGTSKKPDHRA